MNRRNGKVLYPILAVGPLVLLGGIAANARLSEPYWDHTEFGPEQHAKVLAYAGPVKAVKVASQEGKIPSGPRLMQVADLWISGHEKGALDDLYASQMRASDDEVLAQIHSAKVTLVESLEDQSESAIQYGDMEGALSSVILALRVCEIGKYGSFESLYYATNAQSALVRRILKLEPTLSDAQRSKAIEGIGEIASDQTRMNKIVTRLQMVYRRELETELARGHVNDLATVEGQFAQLENVRWDAEPEIRKEAPPEEFAQEVLAVNLLARRALMSESKLREQSEEALSLLARPRASVR